MIGLKLRKPIPLVHREHLRDQADPERVDRVWERLQRSVAAVGPSTTAHRASRPWLALAAAAAVGIAVGVAGQRWVGDHHGPGGDAPMAAVSDRAAPVVFAAGERQRSYALPGGGTITVMPEAIVDTVSVDASGLTLRLVRGQASVTSIAGDGSMRATPVALLVGGAQVVTEGGELRVSRRGDVAELQLVGGRAQVTAPDDEQGVRRTELRSGQSVTVPIRLRTAKLVRPHRPGPSPSPVATATEEEADTPLVASEPVLVGWRSRCDQDDYAGALDQLRTQPGSGMAAIDGAVSAGDLVCISDAYRSRGGDRAVAVRALERLVSDFPSSAHSGNALFQLARLYEQSGDLGRARSYYERYRSLSPTGGLAEDALCQMVLAAAKAGDHDAVARRGAEYREQYPDGPCLEDVERLLAQSEQAPDVDEQDESGSGGAEGGDSAGPYDDDSTSEP